MNRFPKEKSSELTKIEKRYEAAHKKIKQQNSRNQNKYLRVILQNYSSVINKPRPKPEPKPVSESEEENALEEAPKFEVTFRDLSSNSQIDPTSREKQRKVSQAIRLVGSNYPDIVHDYAEGRISMSQLKQRYYSRVRNVNYTCLDDLKDLLKKDTNTASVKIRSCIRSKFAQQFKSPQKSESPSWNFSTKVPGKNYMPLNVVSNYIEAKSENSSLKERAKSAGRSREWRPFSRVDSSVFCSHSRQTSFNEKPTQKVRHIQPCNVNYGGRLSAKAMHDILVETIFPERKPQPTPLKLPKEVKDAVKNARTRVKDHRSTSRGSRPNTAVLRQRKNLSFSAFDVQDSIYIPDTISN